MEKMRSNQRNEGYVEVRALTQTRKTLIRAITQETKHAASYGFVCGLRSWVDNAAA